MKNKYINAGYNAFSTQQEKTAKIGKTLKNVVKNTTPPKKKLPELKAKDKAKLIIPTHLQDQIDWLHKKVGNKEWSGPLIYKINKGSLDNPKTLVFEAIGMWLSHIGTYGGTEYAIGTDIIDIEDEFPQVFDSNENYFMGKIHTHHEMDSYHSATDMQDLHDQADSYPFYLSVVVNFKNKIDTKISAKITVKESSFELKNGKGGIINKPVPKKDYLYLIDVDNELEEKEENVPEHIKRKFKELNKKVSTSKVKTVGVSGITPFTPIDTPTGATIQEASYTQICNFALNWVKEAVRKVYQKSPKGEFFFNVWQNSSEILKDGKVDKIEDYTEALTLSFETTVKRLLYSVDKDRPEFLFDVIDKVNQLVSNNIYDDYAELQEATLDAVWQIQDTLMGQFY